MSQLIRCKDCGQIILNPLFDKCAEQRLDAGYSFETAQDVERDEFKDFLLHHQGHQLESLNIIEDSYVSEKAYAEPVKTSFFKTTNGREKFLIKKSREKIDEPLKYELVSGDYYLKCISVGVQSEEIEKQLKRELDPPPTQDKIDAFLKLLGALIKGIAIQDLIRVPEDSHHPLEVYYRIDEARVAYLLKNCRSIFEGQQYSAIKDFIHRHKEDGVLLLKATHKIQIVQRAKTKKRAAAPLALKNEEIFGQK